MSDPYASKKLQEGIQPQLEELRRGGVNLHRTALASGVCGKEAERASCLFKDPVLKDCIANYSAFMKCLDDTNFWAARSLILQEANALKDSVQKRQCVPLANAADKCFAGAKSIEECREQQLRFLACTIVQEWRFWIAKHADARTQDGKCQALIEKCQKCVGIESENEYYKCAIDLIVTKEPNVCEGKFL